MLPKVIVHNMVSIDGRMDWLNGDLGLYYELSPRTLFVSDDLTSNSELVPAQLAHLEDFPGGYVWLRYRLQRENNDAPRT